MRVCETVAARVSCTRLPILTSAGANAGRRMRWSRSAQRALSLAVLLPAAAAIAVEPVRPVADAFFVERPPAIDGVLDEPEWARAESIGPLTQVEPIEGAAPSKRTEIRILTDADNLYVGVRCWDDDPDGIIARKMQRDGSVRGEDRVAIVIDTFRDHRNGYFFATNPLGARVDALIEDADILLNWDGIWNVKTRIDAQGWTAEFVIPFKTLSFREGSDTWGMNLLRGIRGSQERNTWADSHQNKKFSDPAQIGLLRGMARARQGLGLDVIPSLSLASIYDASRLSGESERRQYTRVTPSGDIRYKITPSLTASATSNTDFGQTQIDDVKVNLSRFALFFPEKREFFLQDEGIFEFSSVGQDAQPFFSRKIGLSAEGETVPIRGGGKLTGRVGPLSIGALVVQQAKQDYGGAEIGSKTLAVTRLKLNVGGESTVGVIGTFGDPQADRGNWLAGTDFNYRTSEVFGDKVLEAGAWYQHSGSYDDGIDRDAGSENAYGIRLSYPNDRIQWHLVAQRIEEDFRPALGFLRRENIVRYRGSWRYRWRPETSIQTVDHGIFGFIGTESDRPEHVTESFMRLNVLDVRTRVGDRLYLYAQADFQDEPIDRRVFDNVAVPEGKHFSPTGGVAVEASASRRVSGGFELFGGEYYDGWRLGFISRVQWEPVRHLLFALSYSHSRYWDLLQLAPSSLCNENSDSVVSACGDAFRVRIATARVALQLSPDLSWNNRVQYDNDSNAMNVQSILRWTLTPGSDLFLVLNQGFLAEDGSLRAGRTEPIIKLSWTFRF